MRTEKNAERRFLYMFFFYFDILVCMNLNVKFELNKELDKKMAFKFLLSSKVGGGDFSIGVTRPHPELLGIKEKDKKEATELINEYFDKYYENNVEILEKEKKAYDIDRLLKFAKDVEKNREDLMQMLRELKNKGKRIVGVSAPAKGMTLLNYCKIGTDILDFVTEKSTLKIGKYTPGMHIPVLPDSELLKQKPDYALLLAWNFAEEIMNNLKDFKSAGGKFIIPIPKPRIVG